MEGGEQMAEKESDLLNDIYREISEKVGLDVAIEIYQMYKGQQITFPVHLFNSKRIQHNIIREYDAQTSGFWQESMDIPRRQ